MTRATSAILGAFVLSAALAAATRAEADLCAPWAGEIDPLPTVSTQDPLLAAWAELRAEQLAEVARLLEPRSRALAHRVWRHARCLDPRRPDLDRGLARSAPVRWFRPRILGAREIEVAEGESVPEPISERTWDLGEPIRAIVARIRVPEEAAPVAPPPRPPPPDASEEIAAAEKALREARFELALDWAERGRTALESQGRPGDRSDQRARLEVLAATAHIALGQEAAARESLERALRAQPGLRLDPALHSPKLVRLLEAVGGRAGAQP